MERKNTESVLEGLHMASEGQEDIARAPNRCAATSLEKNSRKMKKKESWVQEAGPSIRFPRNMPRRRVTSKEDGLPGGYRGLPLVELLLTFRCVARARNLTSTL